MDKVSSVANARRRRPDRRFVPQSLDRGDRSRLERRNLTAPAFYRMPGWLLAVGTDGQPVQTGEFAANVSGSTTQTVNGPWGMTNWITVAGDVASTVTPISGDAGTTGIAVSVGHSANVSGHNDFDASVNYGGSSNAFLVDGPIDPMTNEPSAGFSVEDRSNPPQSNTFISARIDGDFAVSPQVDACAYLVFDSNQFSVVINGACGQNQIIDKVTGGSFDPTTSNPPALTFAGDGRSFHLSYATEIQAVGLPTTESFSYDSSLNAGVATGSNVIPGGTDFGGTATFNWSVHFNISQ